MIMAVTERNFILLYFFFSVEILQMLGEYKY